MISFSCPGCQATFKLPDEMAGKTARCSKCNHRFTVPGGKPKPAPAPAGVAPATAPTPMPPKKAPLMAEVLEAEVIDEPAAAPRRPAQRAGAVDKVDVVDEVQVVDEAAIQEPPRRGRRPMPVADEDEEDDRRRPSRRDRDRDRDRDDWDDDEDPDRPRRKRRRQRSGGSKMGVIMASIGGGSFVMMIICLVGMALSAPPVVRNPAINFNPRPMQFNPVPQPNQGQPNPMQPIQGQPKQGQPKQGQPKQGQPKQGQPNVGNPNLGAAGPARQIQLVNGMFQTQDRITLNDPIDPRRPGYHAKRYTVQLEAGKSYAIEMDAAGAGANEFDPYLRVENQAANFFEEDDDDGIGELDAKIVFLAPQTGTYTITATTWVPRMQGSYRLTIRTPP